MPRPHAALFVMAAMRADTASKTVTADDRGEGHQRKHEHAIVAEHGGETGMRRRGLIHGDGEWSQHAAARDHPGLVAFPDRRDRIGHGAPQVAILPRCRGAGKYHSAALRAAMI